MSSVLVPPGLLAPTACNYQDISPPFPNFSYVDKVYDGDRATRRLFSQARIHGACTLMVEDLPEGGLVQDEN